MKIKKNIENLMIEKITGLSQNQLFLNDFKLSDLNKIELEKLKKRFFNWEPIEYIVEKAEFYGLDFFVDSRVLIPRNDTEIMVEQVLEYIPENTILIDIWTGSSCIPISILKNINKLDEWRILNTYVIDISKKALEVSKINIEKYKLEDKIIQINSNLLEKNPHLASPEGEEYKNIIITANLPYIKNWDFENMDKETIEFEPDLALYWWEKTGFELYEKLIFQIIELINSPLQGGDVWKTEGGLVLFIEIWFYQKKIATKFLEKQNLQFEIFKDNGGVDRCIKIYF